MNPGSRVGSTLVVVLAIALLLASQVYIFLVFTSGGFRHTESVNAHVRAIYVGESAFSQILARIKGAAWPDRWFKDAPARETDAALGEGSYSSWVATVPHPDKKIADIWIQARYDRAVAVMYWRVHVVDDTLDFHARAYPRLFTFLDDQTPAPGASPTDPTLALIQNSIFRQEQNEPRALQALGSIQAAKSFAEVAGTLGIPVPGTVPDRVKPAGSEPRPDQSSYLASIEVNLLGLNINLNLPALPALPGLPAGNLAQQYPEPMDFREVMKQAFLQNGVPEPTTANPMVMGPYFEDPTKTNQEWVTANNPSSQDFEEWMDKCKIVIEEHAKKYQSSGCAPCKQTLDQLVQYYSDVTAQKAATAGLPPPDPKDVDPSPYDASAYARTFDKYKEWWKDRDGYE